MTRSLGGRVAASAAAVALGSLSAVAISTPAHAADVSAPYACTSLLGTQAATIVGALTVTPDPATAGAPVALQLHISQLGLTSPLTVNSWTGTATLVVSGAEAGQVPMTGSGGPIPANQPITGDMSGTWTPAVAGSDEIRGGDVSITANLALIGNVSLTCVPQDPQPVAATLTVD